MKAFTVATVLIFCGILCASPYGRALQQARKVANRPHPAEKELQRSERAEKRNAPGDDFAKLWHQMGSVIKENKGQLPGPAGVAGLRKICGPGKVAPELLKINDFAKLSERNCAWAYMGGNLGIIRNLPQGGEFPILFTKPRPGVTQIKVLMANGQVRILDGRTISNCTGVVNALRRSARSGKHPAWKNLSTAAGLIDRASK